MSTTTIYAKGPRALIASDTAGLDQGGVVRSWVSKVITLPHLRCAITTRGAIAALPALAVDLAAAFPSFDAMVSDGASFLEDAHQNHVMRWSDLAGAPEFELAITGWSVARRRCEAHVISSLDHPGLPAFKFLHQEILMAPTPTAEAMAAAGLMVGGSIPAMDPETFVLGLIELQRRTLTPIGGLPGAPEAYIVGGHLVLTEITEAGITQRVVRTWSDRLNEPIHPADVDLRSSPPAATGVSRQQRRQAEKLARRASRAA